MPIPKVSCSTRSPGASDGTSRFWPRASASARIAAVPNRRVGAPAVRCGIDGSTGRFHEVCAASVRRQSTRSTGSSSRKREAGLCEGRPTRSAPGRGRRRGVCCARVTPTYASRRSSSSSGWSPSERMVREDAVLEAGQEDHRELQALGGVQGHQGDDALVLAVGVVRDLVGVGDQRDPLEEVREAGGGRGLVGRVGRGTERRLVGELARHGDELGEVLDPGLVLGVVGLLELLEVAARREQLLEHHVGALPRVDHRLQLLDHVDEAADAGHRAGGDAGGVLGPAQRLEEGDPVALGERLARTPRRGRRCRAWAR